MTYEGYTVSDLALLLEIPRYTVENRLSRLGIKPLSYEAIYPPDTLDKIKAVKRGRPPKFPPPPADKKGKR
jgi:hypothetical protein